MKAPAALGQARRHTDKLFALVHPDWLYDRPIPERNRIIFYLGHLEAFDWNLLRPHMRGVEPFDADWDRLFAFGIDPVDRGLPQEDASEWPGIEEIRAYNRRIREAIDGAEHEESLLHIAAEHRWMHAETLSYMLHQLPPDCKIAERQAIVPASGHPPNPEMVQVPAGRATLGQARDGSFGWDNEFDQHAVEVPAFRVGRYKVTNGEYLRFVEAGGYWNRDLWDAASWKWKEGRDIRMPWYWENVADEWRYRAMFEEIPLPLNWPVYVSHAEASAYARWTGQDLPTEAEWHRAAYGTPDGEERPYPWGAAEPGPQHGCFHFARWDPAPVDAFPCGASAFGAEGLLANGWEWTSTVFAPFPGFQPFDCYAGYSADFFDGKHYVMKGGSMRTAGRMLRRSFRNWFQPHYPYVYAGFRCVKRG